jgi:hypothetical protein
MKPLNPKLLNNIAKKAGLTPEQIRAASPGELRSHLTKKTGKRFVVNTKFPWIGRGNVLRDGLEESSTINQSIDKILGV